MILAIHGKSNSGKDTVAKAIMCYLNADINWQIRKFAEGVKNHSADLQNINRQKFSQLWEDNHSDFRNLANLGGLRNNEWHLYTQRELLILIGNGSRELISPNIWYNQLIRQYDNLLDNWIITDLRYLNCYEGIKRLGGLVIKVTSYRSNNINNPSETELDNITDWDIVFNNDTTIEALYEQVYIWMKKIKLIKN